MDNEKCGMIDLPIFANIIGYNLPEVGSELLVSFEHEWKWLSGEKGIDYGRFFREYVGFNLETNERKEV